MSKKSTCSQSRQARPHALKPVYAAVLLAFAVESAQANPMDATVVSGQASITTTANTLTVVNTPGTIINWGSFSIGSAEITNFVQQSASSTVLNRVIGNDPSNILGTLQSNGRVFLVNPNGILFGAGSTVNVAGLVASTLNISDADFQAGRYNFTAVPGAQNLSNAGNINAQDSGQIYLIAPNVENSGVITAPNGEIYLAAGSSVELVNSNDPNLRVSITAPAGDATNVGQLIASAGNLGLFGTVVKNSGTASADSATLQGGKIVFRASQRVEAGGTISASGVGGGTIQMLADMQSGTVNVSGTLDASAPVSGNGGFVDTSAAHVQVADTARVNTSAANGVNGTWLIDPTDFYISALDPLNGSSWMSNTTLSTNLGLGNVTIQTLASGTGNGDIFVNDAVTWTTTSNLTLNAIRNVNINAAITSGIPGGVLPGSLTVRSDLNGTGGGTILFGALGSVTLQGGAVAPVYGAVNLYYNPVSYTAPTTFTQVATPYTGWMLVNDVSQLQAMNTNLAGTYALGKDIDATVTAGWNAGAGFLPIGSTLSNFNGKLDGQNHTITNLTVNSGTGTAGMFGVIGSVGVVSNVGLVASSVVGGNSTVGGLAGTNNGTILNSYISNGSVSVSGATSPSVGGLVGRNNGTISGSYVTGGSVQGNYFAVGGLVGINSNGASITDSHVSNVSVSVAGASFANSAGGLVGTNNGSISNSYVSGGSVSGLANIGGLVGYNTGTISGSHVSGGAVNGNLFGVGGLVGGSFGGSISGSYVSNSSVTGLFDVGGLVGNSTTIIGTSYASNTNVTGGGISASNIGGLVGNNNSTIANSYVNGGVVSNASSIGGLVGYNAANATISTSYASNAGLTGTTVGGVAGWNANIGAGALTNNYWDNTTVTGVLNGIGFDAGVGGAASNIGAAPLSTTAMMNSTNLAGFDFINTWWMSDTNTRPFLRSEWNTVISNAHQLQLVSMNLGATYKLGADIDMSATATGTGMWGTGGFVPLGSNPGFPTYGIAFSGQFDGAGHTIGNLYINRPTTADVGLFGYVGTTGILSNVGLLNSNVTGSSNVGVLAGLSVGTISNSYVTAGSVSGTADVGGLVGYSFGTVSNSHYNINTVTINGANHVTPFGLYNDVFNIGSVGQFDDWLNGGLNIADYAMLPGTGGSHTISSMQGMKALLGFADNPAYTFNLAANLNLAAGYYVPYLAANFNGANFTLSSLTINQPYNEALGLFGYIAPTATVSNVVLSNAIVTGGTGVGALAGVNVGSIINSRSINGNVTGAIHVGGLVGYNGAPSTGIALNTVAQVSNSYVSGGSVIGNANVGGLVGSNHASTWFAVGAEITGSYVTSGTLNVTVSGTSNVGGLVGSNAGGGNISNSFVNTGTVVNGGWYVGGLLGWDSGEGAIINNTVTGADVKGDNYVGGLAGNNCGPTLCWGLYDNNHVVGSFVTGSTVQGGSFVGGMVGWNGLTISNSSVTNTVVKGVANVGGLAGYNRLGSANISVSATSFSGGVISNSVVSGGSVTATGSSSASAGGLVGANYGVIIGSYVSGGSVTGNAIVGGLVGYNGLGSRSSSGTWLWLSNGNIVNSYVDSGTVTVVGVTGSVSAGGLVGWNNGNISNSYVNAGTVNAASGDSVGGLVGWNTGSIDFSYVTGGTVTGRAGVGGLAGSNDLGVISNSYVSNTSVSGTSAAGGLVGWNIGSSITASFVAGGSVTGGINVGGLAGVNLGGNGLNGTPVAGSNASILDTYVNGVTVVGGTGNVGGLVGLNQGGDGGAGHTATGIQGGAGGVATISNSYISGGSVSGTGNIGWLVGSNLIGNIGATNVGVGGAAGVSDVTNVFWNTDTFGLTGGIINNTGTLTNVIGLTTAQMMSIASFTSWNSIAPTIANTGGAGLTWRIYEGSTMPLLTSFLKPLNITLNNVTKVYDGLAYTTIDAIFTDAVGATVVPNASQLLGSLYNGAANVGTYALSTAGLYSSQLGYDLLNVSAATLTITPATLTIVANNVSKVLMTPDPLLTYSVYGLKSTDTSATTLSGQLARKAGETVATYPINQGTLSVIDTNYSTTYTYVPGVFTILAPTVINEIVDISVQNTTTLTKEDEKKAAETVVADASVSTGTGDTQSLPMCQ